MVRTIMYNHEQIQTKQRIASWPLYNYHAMFLLNLTMQNGFGNA